MIIYKIDKEKGITEASFDAPWDKTIVYTIRKQFGNQYVNAVLKKKLVYYICTQPWVATVTCKEDFDEARGKEMAKAKLLKRYYHALYKCYKMVSDYHKHKAEEVKAKFIHYASKAIKKSFNSRKELLCD